jgi:hypothetical protein
MAIQNLQKTKEKKNFILNTILLCFWVSYLNQVYRNLTIFLKFWPNYGY